MEYHHLNTGIWQFDLLEMAGHQPQKVLPLMQLSPVVFCMKNTICNVGN